MLNNRNFNGAPLAAGDFSRRQFIEAAALGAVTMGGGFAVPNIAYAAGARNVESERQVKEEKRGARPTIEPYHVPSVTTEEEKKIDIKRLLIVTDYQVDFVSGGVFGDIEPAMKLEDAIYNRVKEYQDAGDIVIYTMDTHPQDDYANTREGQVNEPHCIPETEGWEVYGKVRELLTPENAILIKKGTYGSCDLPFVVQSIINQGIRIMSVEFAGVSTTCRVLHNAILMYNFFPELPMIMDQSTTASYTDEQTQYQLAEMEAWGFIVKR